MKSLEEIRADNARAARKQVGGDCRHEWRRYRTIEQLIWLRCARCGSPLTLEQVESALAAQQQLAEAQGEAGQ